MIEAYLPGLRSLRDVTPSDLARIGPEMPLAIRKRVRHIVSENERTVNFADALAERSMSRAGDLMAESHASLQRDYEVSSKELDLMVLLAKQSGLCLGARMTGGGFGGCTVNLVDAQNAGQFVDFMRLGYWERMGVEPAIYVVSPGAGCGECLTNEDCL
jgi:galactokinase